MHNSENQPGTASCVVLGGTFDPIHFGHLRTAWELHERLGYERVTLMPCGDAYHKAADETPAHVRVEMIRAAIADIPQIQLDIREVDRHGPTYTVETLQELRQELGADAHLTWVVGQDAAQTLDQWHQWQRIFELANLLIVARPQTSLVESQWPEIEKWPVKDVNWQEFRQSAQGAVHRVCLTPMPISSTQIRQILQDGGSARFLVPDQVVNFIEQKQLYRGNH